MAFSMKQTVQLLGFSHGPGVYGHFGVLQRATVQKRPGAEFVHGDFSRRIWDDESILLERSWDGMACNGISWDIITGI